MDLNFRKADLRDLDLLIDYRLLFLMEVQPEHQKESASIKKSLLNFLKSNLENETLRIWMVEGDHRVISMGWLLIREQPGNLALPRGLTGIILNVYTLPEYRRKGLSKTIINRLVEEGRNANLDRIELRATKDGEQLYRQMGFYEPVEKTMELKLR